LTALGNAFVANWALSHASEIKRGESATEWEALEKAHKQEAIDAITKAGQRSKDVWNYINKNYEELFGDKNQVRPR